MFVIILNKMSQNIYNIVKNEEKDAVEFFSKIKRDTA